MLTLELDMTVTKTLRDKLGTMSESLYRVAQDTEISWGTLKRFVNGGGLRSEHVDTLAEYFKLELHPAPEEPEKSAKKRPRKQ